MKSQYALAELASLLGCPLHGDATHVVSSIGDLKTAKSNELSFLNKKQYESALAETQAGCVLVGLNQDVPEHINHIRVENPYLAYARLSGLFANTVELVSGVHPRAIVDPAATIADTAVIGPNCVVEANAVIGENTILRANVFVGFGAKIGSNCELHPQVSIYHECIIGDRVKIHAASTIGSDGFGYAPSSEGWVKIYQLGKVVIGHDVEIGSSCAIDRGAIGDTEIARGVIIDNQVHIAHNVKVGEQTAIAGCVGIAGSAIIGKRCTFGGLVAINGHITLTDDVHIHGGSVVTKSITEPGAYASGSPLQDVKAWRRNMVRVSQLDEWIGKLKQIEKNQNNPE